MINDCTRSPSFSLEEFCCLKHLIELKKYSENQMIIPQYSKFVLKVLNTNYKNETLNTDIISLDILKRLLNVGTFIMTYFYSNQFLDYSKLLCKILLKICSDTPFKEHYDIIDIKLTIINNISSIYIK